jgi:membrane associated rhomboid family serine protease
MSETIIEAGLRRVELAGSRYWSGRARALAGRIADAVAPVTLCCVVCLVAVWFLERALMGQVHGGRRIGYLAFGGLPNASIVGRGDPAQWWRFVSSGLLHDRTNPFHLAANATALIVVGSVIERLYGRLVMLSTLVLGVVTGCAAWMVASALGWAAVPDYTIGCSAGVCALVGMMLVYGYRHGRHLSRSRAQAMKAQAALGIALMLLSGLLVPDLNNVAHGAGLLCGALLAAILPGGRDVLHSLGWRLRAVFASVVMLASVSILLAAHNLAGRLTA